MAKCCPKSLKSACTYIVFSHRNFSATCSVRKKIKLMVKQINDLFYKYTRMQHLLIEK